MQNRSLFIALVAAILIGFTVSSCHKTIELGNKPTLEFTTGSDQITHDSTLVQDKKYKIGVKVAQAEDQTPNTSFEVVRTYSGGSDTSVYYANLMGEDQTLFNYVHTFTTLKKAGTERFTFTVKNNYGIVNQKILIMTVK